MISPLFIQSKDNENLFPDDIRRNDASNDVLHEQ